VGKLRKKFLRKLRQEIIRRKGEKIHYNILCDDREKNIGVSVKPDQLQARVVALAAHHRRRGAGATKRFQRTGNTLSIHCRIPQIVSIVIKKSRGAHERAALQDANGSRIVRRFENSKMFGLRRLSLV
jgi:hypothetical protein